MTAMYVKHQGLFDLDINTWYQEYFNKEIKYYLTRIAEKLAMWSIPLPLFLSLDNFFFSGGCESSLRLLGDLNEAKVAAESISKNLSKDREFVESIFIVFVGETMMLDESCNPHYE